MGKRWLFKIVALLGLLILALIGVMSIKWVNADQLLVNVERSSDSAGWVYPTGEGTLPHTPFYVYTGEKIDVLDQSKNENLTSCWVVKRIWGFLPNSNRKTIDRFSCQGGTTLFG